MEKKFNVNRRKFGKKSIMASKEAQFLDCQLSGIGRWEFSVGKKIWEKKIWTCLGI